MRIPEELMTYNLSAIINKTSLTLKDADLFIAYLKHNHSEKHKDITLDIRNCINITLPFIVKIVKWIKENNINLTKYHDYNGRVIKYISIKEKRNQRYRNIFQQALN